VHILNIMSK